VVNLTEFSMTPHHLKLQKGDAKNVKERISSCEYLQRKLLIQGAAAKRAIIKIINSKVVFT